VDIKEINLRVIEQFRAGGEMEGMQRDRLVVLTTVGVKTGQRRSTPMMFHRDGDRVLVIASNVGAPEHPHWYINLVANPHVSLEIGDETYDATATTAEGAERARLWSMLKETYPFFADHEAKTDRTIPVVVLTRA
jgi:deazaflavin-dependent oxidoreductase (nitroreductase family)